jgi:sec-independent protein translocase protein TatA
VPFGIGWVEILILLLVALLIFGPKRLPEMGRSLGKGLREFKDSVSGNDKDDDRPADVPAELPTAAAESRAAESRERDTVG